MCSPSPQSHGQVLWGVSGVTAVPSLTEEEREQLHLQCGRNAVQLMSWFFFPSFLGILWHFHKLMAQLFRVVALSPRRKGTLWQTGTLWDLATCSLGPKCVFKCVFVVTLSSNSDCTSYPFFNWSGFTHQVFPDRWSVRVSLYSLG